MSYVSCALNTVQGTLYCSRKDHQSLGILGNLTFQSVNRRPPNFSNGVRITSFLNPTRENSHMKSGTHLQEMRCRSSGEIARISVTAKPSTNSGDIVSRTVLWSY